MDQEAVYASWRRITEKTMGCRGEKPSAACGHRAVPLRERAPRAGQSPRIPTCRRTGRCLAQEQRLVEHLQFKKLPKRGAACVAGGAMTRDGEDAVVDAERETSVSLTIVVRRALFSGPWWPLRSKLWFSSARRSADSDARPASDHHRLVPARTVTRYPRSFRTNSRPRVDSRCRTTTTGSSTI